MILTTNCLMNFGWVRMIYLLDTHVFLWLDAEPEKLSGRVSAILKNRENLLFVSHVSVWEIQVKQQIGKLNLRVPLEELLQQQEQLNQNSAIFDSC
jgi:PIN domain nuclease of toxin-antitoxin system